MPYMTRAANANPGSDGYKVVDCNVVRQHHLRHDDDMPRDRDVSCQVHVSQKDRAGTDYTRGADGRSGMDHGRVALVVEVQSVGEHSSRDIVVRPSRADQNECVRVVMHSLDRSQYRGSGA